ncbi:ABC transporter permease [Patulibacter defluvii]|uniref:ABC transporter permease n=1 Tax=Patulibacter defluvii TaxID=3095358 RepID=UPI002A74D748|nr:ABC transporter permease [Patulibacter sp. DM4]
MSSTHVTDPAAVVAARDAGQRCAGHLPAPPSPQEPFAEERRGLLWLCEREILRFLKLWVQTIVAPVISSLLFIVVFGIALGDRIAAVDGVPYDQFIVPGLVVQAILTAAYSNNSSTLFQARSDRFLNDVLSSPLRWWEVNIGVAIGGVVRGLLTGAVLLVAAVLMTGVAIEQPLILVVATALVLVAFAQLGVIAGIYAKSWDFMAFVTTLVILPLSFLGGIFYSVDRLPEGWQVVSHLNPIFYLVQAFREGFSGTSDVPIGLSLAVVALLAVTLSGWCAWLFRTGHRLKP